MTQIEGCQHHWMIEMPAGTSSRGVCCKCHEVRLFGNVFEDVLREDYKARMAQTPERVLIPA